MQPKRTHTGKWKEREFDEFKNFLINFFNAIERAFKMICDLLFLLVVVKIVKREGRTRFVTVFLKNNFMKREKKKSMNKEYK